MSKACKDCGDTLDECNWFLSFQKSYNYLCKTCSYKRVKSYREKNREDYLGKRKQYSKKRKRENRCFNLRNNYGISADEWDEKFLSQGSCCDICGTQEAPSMGWHTDHNHETGLLRGILCYSCNVGLGNFKDSLEILAAAQQYLMKYDKEDLI